MTDKELAIHGTELKMTDTELVKAFTYEKLRKACKASVKTNRNASVDWASIEPLVEKGNKHPLTFEMVHNDVEMRVRVMISHDNFIILDIPFDTYNQIDVYEVPRIGGWR